jgi:hypothetical protein
MSGELTDAEQACRDLVYTFSKFVPPFSAVKNEHGLWTVQDRFGQEWDVAHSKEWAERKAKAANDLLGNT